MLHTPELNINLTPIMQYDPKSQRFIIYYDEFPQLIATGVDINDVKRKLANLVEEYIAERQELIKVVNNKL